MKLNPKMHDMLPWYVRGTLESEERDSFEAHLSDCLACRSDLAWIREMQAELDAHGAALLEAHPDPDRLVRAAQGRLNAAEESEIRRHLALCATCGLEASWVTGDAVAELRPVRSSEAEHRGWAQRLAVWGWLPVAAAMLALVVFQPWDRREVDGDGLYRPAYVTPTERADGDVESFNLAPDDTGLLLLLEIDLPVEAFPFDLEIVDSAGDAVYRQTDVGRDRLVQQLYLIVPCDRGRCRAGDYEVRIVAGGSARPSRTLRFAVRAGN